MTGTSPNPQGDGSSKPESKPNTTPEAAAAEPGDAFFAFPNEGDPTPKEPVKPDAGDPGKAGTTPAAGSEKANEDQTPLLAGKYRSTEALAEGYQNLFSEKQKIAMEAAQVREERDRIQAELETLKKGGGSTPPKPGTTPDPAKPTSDQKPWRNDPRWQQLTAKAIPVLGDEGVELLDELAAINLAIVEQKTAPDPADVAEREAARYERLQRQFLEIHPDAAKYTDGMKAIIEESQKRMDDPMFWQELAYGAARARNFDAEIDQLRERLRPEIEKELLAKLRAGGTVIGSVAGQGGASGEDGMEFFAMPPNAR
jgi:hypothetical protein